MEEISRKIQGPGRGRPLISLAVASLLLTLGVACGGSSKGPSASSGQNPSTTPSQNASSSGAGTTTKTIDGQQINFEKSVTLGKQSSIELETESFFFTPTLIKGKPGQAVTLEIKNKAAIPHNFTLVAQHINHDIAPGQSASVKVTLPQSGTLLFHCRFHQSFGMQGALQVSS